VFTFNDKCRFVSQMFLGRFYIGIWFGTFVSLVALSVVYEKTNPSNEGGRNGCKIHIILILMNLKDNDIMNISRSINFQCRSCLQRQTPNQSNHMKAPLDIKRTAREK
jgi:hypothetical protein